MTNLITDDGMTFMEKVETLMLCCHGNFVNCVNRSILTSSLFTETPSRDWLVLMNIIMKNKTHCKWKKQARWI